MMRHIYLSLLVGFCSVVESQAHAADSISVKNFRQIFDSLRVVTGVAITPEINQAYLESKSRLPRYGRIDEVGAPMLLAVSALSGAFCKRMIALDAMNATPGQRRAHRLVNFAEGPAGLTAEIRTTVIQEYSRLFWQRDALPSEIELLNTQMTDAAATLGTTPADTLKLLLVSCTTVASSLESFIY